MLVVCFAINATRKLVFAPLALLLILAITAAIAAVRA
jgi:hypothetical protein